MKKIIIGVGNTFRRDDGAGIFIVRELKKQLTESSELKIAESHGEGTSLMDLWEGFEQVVLFDAVMANGEPGKTCHLLADTNKIPSDFFKYSSHAFSVAEAVELSRVLGKLPQQFEIYGVEGEDFSHGEELSAAVEKSCLSITDEFIDQLG